MSDGAHRLTVKAEIHSSDKDDSADTTTTTEMCSACGRPVKNHIEAGNGFGAECIWKPREPTKAAANSQELPADPKDATSPPKAAPEKSSPSKTVSEDEIAKLQAERDKLLRQYEAARLQQEIAGLRAALGTSVPDLATPSQALGATVGDPPTAPVPKNVAPPPPTKLQNIKHQPQIKTALKRLSSSVDFLNDILSHSTDGDDYFGDQETLDTEQWSPSSSFVKKDEDPNLVASRTGYLRQRMALQSDRLRDLSRKHSENRVGIDHVRDWLENSHAAHNGEGARTGSTDSEFPSTSSKEDRRFQKHNNTSKQVNKISEGMTTADAVVKTMAGSSMRNEQPARKTPTTDTSQSLATSEEAPRRRSRHQSRKQETARPRDRESKNPRGAEVKTTADIVSHFFEDERIPKEDTRPKRASGGEVGHPSSKHQEKQDARSKKAPHENLNPREPRKSSRSTSRRPHSPSRSPRRHHSPSRSPRRHHSPSRSPRRHHSPSRNTRTPRSPSRHPKTRRQPADNRSRRDTPDPRRRATKNEPGRSHSMDVEKNRPTRRGQRPSAKDPSNLRSRRSTETSSDGKTGIVRGEEKHPVQRKRNPSGRPTMDQTSDAQKGFFDGFKGSFLNLVGGDEQKERNPAAPNVSAWGEDTGRSHRNPPDDSSSHGFLGGLKPSVSLSWDKDGRIQEERNQAGPFMGSYAGGEDGGNRENVGFLQSLGQTFGVSQDENKQKESPAWTDDIKGFIFGSREVEDIEQDDRARLASLNVGNVFGIKEDDDRRQSTDITPAMMSQMSEKRGQKAEEEPSSFWNFLGFGGSDDVEPPRTSRGAEGRKGATPATRRGDNPVKDFFIDLF
ncbi:PREDICTED: serine/arginine repetitive matrix protein 2-like [Branchiostoma belcheri]|uniref:Serine/arginine repetitive matrix protein 2-like n=1 Tax=Branchiostoma belcheri TaxID=7741 RepID=A0A6P4ZK98_BRABE|nr:PREDICTED: serine/arginine repetitive matrix protein 2-like [Branchiostoma belcheri]